MKTKTSELQGAALDWAVAKCEGHLEANHVVVDFEYMFGHNPIRLNPLPEVYYEPGYSPSTNWAQGGPIIEREEIELTRGTENSNGWTATIDLYEGDAMRESCTGPTPLIAAMRCYVASHLGDEIEVPNELTGE